MIHLFCGYETREAIGFHVFVRSVIERATQPVAIIPIGNLGKSEGSNAFTFSRFEIPRLMGYSGHAIFADASDMLARRDIAELDALFDPACAIQVVKHPTYKTRHKVKYIGTELECPNTNYDRKNWMSLAIFNCAHPIWKLWKAEGLAALQLRGIHDDLIGELPAEWNRLVDEGHPTDGAICHWTAGIPGFPHYAKAPCADHWHAERKALDL